jgi:hypothetical protein
MANQLDVTMHMYNINFFWFCNYRLQLKFSYMQLRICVVA